MATRSGGALPREEPDERWRTARDIFLELQAPHTTSTSGRPALSAARTWARGDTGDTLRTRQGRFPIAPAIALTLLVVAILALLAWRAGLVPTRRTSECFQRTDAPALAILPIRSLDATDTAAVQVRLASLTRSRPTWQIFRRFACAQPPPPMSLQRDSLTPAAVGQRLNVDHVITGTVRRTRDGYRFTLQLIQTADDVLLWGGRSTSTSGTCSLSKTRSAATSQPHCSCR